MNRHLMLALVLVPALSACQGQSEPIPEPGSGAAVSPDLAVEPARGERDPARAEDTTSPFPADLVGVIPAAPV